MILAALLSFLLKSALLLGAGRILCGILSCRLSASARFRLGMALVLALPFLALSSLLAPGSLRPYATLEVPARAESEGEMGGGAIDDSRSRADSRRGSRSWLSVDGGRLVLSVPQPAVDALVLAWAAGFCFCAASALGSALPRKAVPGLAPCRDEGWLEALESARRQLGLRRSVSLVEDPGCQPYAFGLGRPAIAVPPATSFWSAERKRAALLHEVAHHKRRDLATRLAARLLVGSVWCLPFGRPILAMLIRDGEAACDEMAIGAGADPFAFASLLVELARFPASSPRTCALGATGIRDIERRVRMIIQRAGGEVRHGRAAAALALTAALATALGLGFASPVVAEDQPRAASIDLSSWIEGESAAVGSYPLAGLPLASPVGNGDWHVSSGFGLTKNPFDGKDYFHRGIDIAERKAGGIVRSTMAGTVLESGYDEQNGFFVLIGDAEVSTFFAHLGKGGPAKGTVVSLGDSIGVVGASGRATGPHLHYEVRIKDRFIDPLPLLAAGNVSFARSIPK